ncbi:MAG: disulfide bond formation protein DsbA [Burkholderiales bacterium PBB4]|nr:MAG: disulfide bond formation protein DsbA [Burkholderiales bacterium PBB4]
MKTPLKIDFVSDVSCPWCAVGLASLEQALGQVQDSVSATLTFQPFELNPQMVVEGEDIGEHLAKKYGSTPDQAAAAREAIRARGAELGFTFAMDKRARIYNTFNAHRLLHWAQIEGPSGAQVALKKAYLKAYFTDGENPSDKSVLVRVAGEVGLDKARAQAILDSDEFASDVREHEQFYLRNGINSVPAVIINDKHLISGGQPPEVFANALRRIAAETSA